MELYQLKTFVTVAREGHLTRAAEQLNTSQPAVSGHIKALEEILGVTLFERTPKGMRLTPEGILLRQKADQVLQAADAMHFTAGQLKDEVTGDVRLGLNTDPQFLRVTGILAELKRDYPSISLNYIQRMTWEAPDELHAGGLDAAFVYAYPHDDAIIAHSMERVPLVIVGPIAWQDRLSNASLVEMAAMPWIWMSHQCPLYDVLKGLFADLDCKPVKAVITDQEVTIHKMVTAGVGLSIMSQIEAEASVAAGQICIAGRPVASMDLSLIYLRKRAQDPLVKAILGSIAKAWQRDDLALSKAVHESGEMV